MIGGNVSPRKLCNFLIDADIAEALKIAKARDQEAEAVIIRRALREYLKRSGALVEKTDRKRVSARKRP